MLLNAWGEGLVRRYDFDVEHPQIIEALHEQQAADVRRRLDFD